MRDMRRRTGTEMKLYKIINKNGRFSKGSAFVRFTLTGKVWERLEFLKRHLGLLGKNDISLTTYEGCEVVEYELKEVRRMPVKAFMENEMKMKSAA